MRYRLPAAALLALSLAAPGALAAGPDDKADPKVAARALADHARALYDQGKYAEAIDSLEHAERLFHAPTLVFALARAHAALGKLVEARALFIRVRDEKLAPDAPAPFQKVKADAPGEIEALDKRIPTMTILVRGGGGKSLRVSVDDVELKDYQPDKPVRVNPGAHRVKVVPFGGVGVTKSVDLKEGARAALEIELAGAAPAVVRAPVAPGPANDGPRPWRAPAFTFIGLSAATAALGIGTGVYTAVESGRFKRECGSGPCPKSYDPDLRLARAMGVTSTVAFIAAPVLLVPGIVLLAAKPGAATKAPAKVGLQVGLGSVELGGVF